VIIGVLVLLSLILVPLAGGRLSRLADLQLRLIPLAVGALVVQVLAINVFPGGSHTLHAAVHIATYAVLAGVLAANLRRPGMAVIALGGLANAAAIVANAGVMPASADALATAGLAAEAGGYTNSTVVDDARLAFLGDVFALPAWMPAANVFSVGDLLLALGAAIAVHAVCGSRLAPRARARVQLAG
jgi:hypothetical protein